MGMRDRQEQIISELGVHPRIDVDAEIRRRTDFLDDYLQITGAAGFVLGISGGQDSSLAGRLCQLAVEQRRERGEPATFTAVRLPYGDQADEEDAERALDFIRPQRTVTFNIRDAVDGFAAEFIRAEGTAASDFNRGNIKARARMIAQYALAAPEKALVVGTDHAAEAVTGFYTKYGDGAADVTPLSGLDKRQGAQLLQALGAPARLYEKIPTADLLDDRPGQSDEENLGVAYTDIDAYLEGEEVPADIAARIEALHAASMHKRRLPVSPRDTWWRE